MILISIAIFFYLHHLCSGYHTQLILSAVKPRHGNITVIPSNMECYTSFTINDVTFIDSCQSMLSSLDKLFSNLGKDQFRETRKQKIFRVILLSTTKSTTNNNVTEGGKEGDTMHAHEDYQNHPYQPLRLMPDQQQQIKEDLALMTRKGVYPYEFVDSLERFQEPQLPSKDAFYSSLTEEDISEIDYIHAQRVFNHFDMADLGDYHNFYLLTNALLQVDVFENFRDVIQLF